MAIEGPAQGTNMGSIQALNTSSSVSGATTWFLNQRMSLRHNTQNHGSAGTQGHCSLQYTDMFYTEIQSIPAVMFEEKEIAQHKT